MSFIFSLTDGSVGRNVIVFQVNMGPSVHTDNKRKDSLVLDKGPTLHEQQKLYISLILQNQIKDLY